MIGGTSAYIWQQYPNSLAVQRLSHYVTSADENIVRLCKPIFSCDFTWRDPQAKKIPLEQIEMEI